jgi:two-component system chemotaxis sensor kinase CheA
MDKLLRDFLDDSAENLGAQDEAIARLEAEPQRLDLLVGIFRVFHTIKGTCGFLGLTRLGRAAHAAENVLERLRDGTIPVTPAAIGLVAEHIDRMRMLVSATAARGVEPDLDEGGAVARRSRADEAGASKPELRSVRIPLDQIDGLQAAIEALRRARGDVAAVEAFHPGLKRLDAAIAVLAERIVRLRMAPLGNAWIGLHRLVRDLGQELGKRIDLSIVGAELEIARRTAELLKDPMVHMVRNAADHGLETAEERRAAGKPEAGQISIRAMRRDGHLLIDLSDDGRGLPLERIRARAVEAGLVPADEAGRMASGDIARFVFRGGLSTADRVTGVSGRGIGLDVVRAVVEALGGTIDLRTAPGQGTSFAIRIPEAPVGAPAEDGEAERTPRLLLVDDSGGFRDLVEPLLTAAGYAVSTASDCAGIAALRAEGRGFDLVLVDPQTPGLDIGALVDALAAAGDQASAPIFALVAEGGAAAAVPAWAAAVIDRSDSAALLARVGAATGQGRRTG